MGSSRRAVGSQTTTDAGALVRLFPESLENAHYKIPSVEAAMELIAWIATRASLVSTFDLVILSTYSRGIRLGHMSAVKTKTEELKDTIAKLDLETYLNELDEQGYTVVPPSVTRVSEA